MQKVNSKREDAGGRLLELNVDPYFMPTTEENIIKIMLQHWRGKTWKRQKCYYY